MANKEAYKQISESKKIIKDVMQANLTEIADEIIRQVMVNFRKYSDAYKLNAIKNINPPGLLAYRKELLSALAVVASDAIKQARKEVPRAKSVRLEEKIETIMLGEFEDLPVALRKRILAQSDLLVDTQLADLEKAIYFQYASDVGDPVTEAHLQVDMEEKAYAYIEGTSVETGAGLIGAEMVNEARSAFFFDDEVLNEIVAFEFVNGDPVSLICQSLAGLVFDKNDPMIGAYTPPLHFNCKSYIVPILSLDKGMKIEKFTPRSIEGKSNADILKSIQFAETIKHCSCCAENFNSF